MSTDEKPQHPVAPPADTSGITHEIDRLVDVGEIEAATELISQLHPADLAQVLVNLPGRARNSLLERLPLDIVGQVAGYANPWNVSRLFGQASSRTLTRLIRELRPERAASLLRGIPGVRDVAINEARAEPTIAHLLENPEGTAGALMTARFPSIPVQATVRDAVDALRADNDPEFDFSHVMVVDADNVLVGRLSVVAIAVSEPGTAVQDLTIPIITSVTPATEQREIAYLANHYNLKQVPVVDEIGRIQGVIQNHRLVDAIVQEDTESMFKTAAMSGDHIYGPLVDSVRSRFPWLIVNLATTFLAAATISLFESTLARIVILASFLPVVAGQGGIGGTQTLVLVVRSIALGELVGASARRVLIREATLGMIHGVLLGVLVGLVAVVWKGIPMLGLILGLAMLGNMIVAGLVGAGVPVFLRRLGVDPAVASAVVVTTFTDVLGFLLFLGMAALVVEMLV